MTTQYFLTSHKSVVSEQTANISIASQGGLTPELLDGLYGINNWVEITQVQYDGFALFEGNLLAKRQLLTQEETDDHANLGHREYADGSSENGKYPLTDVAFINHADQAITDKQTKKDSFKGSFITGQTNFQYNSKSLSCDHTSHEGAASHNTSDPANNKLDQHFLACYISPDGNDSEVLTGIDATALNKIRECYLVGVNHGYSKAIVDVNAVDTTALDIDTHTEYTTFTTALDAVIMTLPAQELSSYLTVVKDARTAALLLTGDLTVARAAIVSPIVAGVYDMTVGCTGSGTNWGIDELGRNNIDASNPV